MPRSASIAFLLVLYMLFLPTPAAAQQSLTASVEFGYDGIVAAERWTPIRFILTRTGDPVSGTLTVRYKQDGSQDASTSVRFSLTPGVLTPVDVVVCMQRYNRNMSVTIRSDSGAMLLADNLDFDRPERSREITFRPPVITESGVTLLAVGLDELGQVNNAWSAVLIDAERNFTGDGSVPSRTIAQRMRISNRDPGAMFSSWGVYDGIGAMVVRASAFSRLPERARRAIFLWQSGGGQLVIVIDDGSSVWQSWLPEGFANKLIAIGDSREVASTDAFAGLPAHAELSGLGTEEIASPAARVNARPISLSAAAIRSGWVPRFDLGDGSALAATGPVGLGFVTLIGFDPARATALRSRTSAAVAWAAVLDRFVVDPSVGKSQMNFYGGGSGADGEERQSIDTLVNAGVHGEGIGFGALLAVVAVLVVFVLGIGPIDAIVLRRLRLRHWSWLSALVWVALASVLAVQIPSLTVGGRTHLGRLAITDAVLDPAGDSVACWSTALTAIYAGKTGPVGPLDARPGAAWRGVSPLELWQWDSGNQTSALGTLRLVQRPEIAPGGARETITPVGLAQRGWTARALLDVSPESPPVSARVTGGDDRRLELRAVTPGTEVIAACVTIGDRRWILESPEIDAPVELVEGTGLTINRAAALSLAWSTHNGILQWDILADLPGAPARSRALTALTASPSFALVEILYTSPATPFEVIGADAVTVHGAVRLAVPIASPNAETNP